MDEMEKKQKNFIEEIVEEDLRTGRVKETHALPPEPTDTYHWYTKAMHDFGIADKYGGKCNFLMIQIPPRRMWNMLMP